MEIVRALYGDTSIVNCIQPHPSACVVVSSGIDTAVKVWSPTPEVRIKYNTIKKFNEAKTRSCIRLYIYAV